MTVGETTDPVVAPTWVAAFAAAATAFFALVQIGREWWHEHLRRQAANARIEAIAYELRRLLRSWLGEPAGTTSETQLDDRFETWIRAVQNAGTLGEHLDRAEQRVDALMALRPDASSPIGRALHRAHVKFKDGTSRLNAYVAHDKPTMREMWSYIRLKSDARKDFRECAEELERFILHDTLATERDLQQKRDAEDPLNEE